MKNGKSKCNCAQRGGMCGRKRSLIKRGEVISDTIENKETCPLKILSATLQE